MAALGLLVGRVSATPAQPDRCLRSPGLLPHAERALWRVRIARAAGRQSAGVNAMRLLHAIVVSVCLLLAAPNVVYAQQTPAPEDDAYKAVEGCDDAINH